MLKIHRSTGDQLSESELRALHAFRLSIVRLKSTVPFEYDYQKFVDLVRRAQYVRYFTDDVGEIRGCFCVHYQVREFNGRKCLIIEPEIGFAHKKSRGERFIREAFTTILLKLRIKYAFTPIYIVGGVYPHSYLGFRRLYANHIWTLYNMDIPTLELSILQDFIRRYTNNPQYNWGVISVNTIHTESNNQFRKSLAQHPYFREYETFNPKWTQGYTLAFVIRLGWWHFLTMALSPKSYRPTTVSTVKTYAAK